MKHRKIVAGLIAGLMGLGGVALSAEVAHAGPGYRDHAPRYIVLPHVYEKELNLHVFPLDRADTQDELTTFQGAVDVPPWLLTSLPRSLPSLSSAQYEGSDPRQSKKFCLVTHDGQLHIEFLDATSNFVGLYTFPINLPWDREIYACGYWK